jgi:predicted transcriptional regulator
MTVRDIAQSLDLSVCCGEENLDHEITGGYTGDLMSDVIAHSKSGDIWVTMQAHVNIVAVALLKDLAAIILVNGRHPAEDTLKKAIEENIPVLISNLPAFDITGKLYMLGVNSKD